MVLLAAAIGFSFFTSNAQNNPLGVGDRVPPFVLKDQFGVDFDMSQHLGKYPMVIYFYPKDDTPGCTTEACEFRDNIFAFRDLNAQILGVSLDDSKSHKSFADEYSLPFPLLADTEGTAATAYGVKTRMLGMTVAKRQTFIIAPDGTIAKHYDSVNPETHSIQVLDDLVLLSAAP